MLTLRESPQSPNHAHAHAAITIANHNNNHDHGHGSGSTTLLPSSPSSMSPSLSSLSYDRDNGKYAVHNHRQSSKSQWMTLVITLAAVVSFIMIVFFMVLHTMSCHTTLIDLSASISYNGLIDNRLIR
jgi:ATP-dependent Zn protease